MRYVLYIRFNESRIDLIVSRPGDKPADAVAYTQNNYSKCYDAFRNFILLNSNEDDKEILSLKEEYLHKVLPDVHELVRRRVVYIGDDFDEYYYHYKYSSREKFHFEMMEYLHKVLKSKDHNIVYAFLVLSVFLINRKGEKNNPIITENILAMLLEENTVFEVENGKCAVSIGYDDIKKVIKRLK